MMHLLKSCFGAEPKSGTKPAQGPSEARKRALEEKTRRLHARGGADAKIDGQEKAPIDQFEHLQPEVRKVEFVTCHVVHKYDPQLAPVQAKRTNKARKGPALKKTVSAPVSKSTPLKSAMRRSVSQ